MANNRSQMLAKLAVRFRVKSRPQMFKVRYRLLKNQS
jgi:hypothetical protein